MLGSTLIKQIIDKNLVHCEIHVRTADEFGNEAIHVCVDISPLEDDVGEIQTEFLEAVE